MGGACSKSYAVAVDSVPDGSSGSGDNKEKETGIDDPAKPKWRIGDTKAAAKKKYVLEGSLPRNCSDILVELRTFLNEPILLARFGRYAQDLQNFNTLMCWADVMVYSQIDEKSFDYQSSQLLHFYDKYLIPDAVCDMSNIVKTMSGTFLSDLEHKIKSVRAGYEQQLSRHLLDVFGQHCLQYICEAVFIKFKSSLIYTMSVKELKSNYNQIAIDDFEYMEMLGHGSYGFVVHCLKKSTNKHYAMKIQTKCGLLDCFNDCPERVTFEKEAIASCRHPFIVSMDYAFQTETLALMVMDLGTAGTLADACKWTGTGFIDEERVMFYSAEIVLALAHIHKMGLIYRDLKPPNVLLNADGHIQLVDLGGIVDVGGKVLGYSDPAMEAEGLFADSSGGSLGAIDTGTVRSMRQPGSPTRRPSGKTETFRSIRSAVGGNTITTKLAYSRAEVPTKNLKRATSIMGTGGYMAPEMLVMLHQEYQDMKGYTKAVDYWSLGVMMFKLLTGSLPFNNTQVASFIEHCQAQGQPNDANGNKNYPSAYAHFFRKLTAVGGIKPETMNIITSFLEVDEKARLGSGDKGVNDIKTHQYFSKISWRLLERKTMAPPFVPIIERDVDEYVPFDNFQECLASIGKDMWSTQGIAPFKQKYFEKWEFISPAILKTEMGIEELSDGLNSTMRINTRNNNGAANPFSEIAAVLSTINSVNENGSRYSIDKCTSSDV